MTTPTIFSDVASNPFIAKGEPQGNLSEKTVTTVPAATAVDTVIGIHRFEPGYSLVALDLSVDGLDTGATMTLDIGYVYDNGGSEVLDAFFDGLTEGQAGGSVFWPQGTGAKLVGESFVATDCGYLAVIIRDAVTDTEGDIRAIPTFTYDL